nr:hypothetical protein [Tanacetum cinerariifolium]
MNQNNFEPNHSGFDQPSQYSIDHQPSIIQQDLNMKLISDELMIEQRNELFKAMQSMFEEFRQQEEAANLSTHTSEPSRRFNFICNDHDDDDDDEERTIPLRDIISQLPSSIIITTSPLVLPTFEDPEDSLIMRNEDLSNPIPSESEDTSGSDSDCDLSACENNFTSGNPTLSFNYEVKSLSPSIPYEDSDPLLEETDILLSHFDDSLPEYETFSFDIEEKSSCGTTTHSDYSLSDYEAFYFHDDHIEDKSSGSTTTHSDFSPPEYDSFIFDLSIDPFPPTDRSVSHHEEFADELTHIYLHQNWLRVVSIYRLGQTMNGKTYRSVMCYRLVSCAGIIGIKHRHNAVRDTLVDICFRSGISAGKEVDIGVGGGRDKALRPADAVTLMKRIRKFSVAQDIGARDAIHIFNRIDFSIAKEVGTQLVSRLPSNLL